MPLFTKWFVLEGAALIQRNIRELFSLSMPGNSIKEYCCAEEV
jgi:hypothetical protein